MKKEHAFKVGEKVKISEKSEYYGQHDGVGEITAVHDYSLSYTVVWPDGYHNAYDDHDLLLVL